MSYTYTYLCDDPNGCHEAITHLAAAGSDESFRTLIAATRTAIFSSNDRTGNWRILADGLGGGADDAQCETCSSRRFSSTQLGNYVLFTNNFNPVLAWRYGDPPSGDDLWSAHPVEELLIIGISRARTITEYNGFVIVGNVDIEGVHRGSRIYWSDYNAPLHWIPDDQSLAGYHEFELGEKVLRVEKLGRMLMVYTDKSIYQGAFVGGDLVFQFTIVPTDNPLVYPHSLVNTGNAHIYGSHNGIYVATPSDPRPTRYEWIHKADAAIYVGVDAVILGGFEGLEAFGPVNQAQCEQFVGGYNQLTEEVWFSWPTDDNICPNMSLVLNLRYGAADLVDHGFTAFVNYKPDYRPSIREWLNSEGICPVTPADFVKEGYPADMDGGESPLYLWNEEEDPTQEIDPDSWCARLGDTTVADECDDCDSSPSFIMADSEDFTLKESHPESFFREQYSSSTGTWTSGGYWTLLQSDMSLIGSSEEKIVKQLVVDYEAAEQEPPSDLVGQVAYSSQPKCNTWKDLGTRELRCLTELSAAQHEANNTRPDLQARYPTFYRGKFIGWRVYVAGVGGSSCFGRAVLTVAKANARNH